MRLSRAVTALFLSVLAAALVVVVAKVGPETGVSASSAPDDGLPPAAIATNRSGLPLYVDLHSPGQHVYDLGHGVKVYAFWTPGARNVPSVTMVHGGYWRFSDATVPYYYDWAEKEQARGWAAFSIDYRLVPSVSWPAPLDDVERAIRWIRAHAGRFGLDLDKNFLVGHSAGGQLASVAGLDMGGFAGVASISGADDPLTEYRSAPNVDLRQSAAMLVGGRVHDDALWQSTRAVTYLGPHVMPFLVMQSVHDPTVPISTGRAFARALAAAGYPLTEIEVPGDVHSLTTFDDLRRIDRWMDSILLGSEKRELVGSGNSGS